MMNANKTNDKFNRSTTAKTDIAINKIEVTLDRFRELKGTEIERVLRTFAAIMAEADRHIAMDDKYFDYKSDKINAEARLNMIISLSYKEEGNLEKIVKDYCFKNGKAEVNELSDHYWAIPHNN